MMKDSSALEEKGGKTFRNTEEWLRLLRDDRIEKIEVFPEKYNIDQRLFILYTSKMLYGCSWRFQRAAKI